MSEVGRLTQNFLDMEAEITRLTAENARLKAELATSYEVGANKAEQYVAERKESDRLTAENARLKLVMRRNGL